MRKIKKRKKLIKLDIERVRNKLNKIPKSLADSSNQKNVLLICWDGAERTIVKKMLESAQLPNLQQLNKIGAFVNIDVTCKSTVTKPAHAEMLSGLPEDITGVYTNNCYQSIPKGLTIFERLREQYGEKITLAMLTSKGKHVNGLSYAEASSRYTIAGSSTFFIKEEPECNCSKTPDDPFYNATFIMDFFDGAIPKDRLSWNTGPLCLEVLEHMKNHWFFTFLHFADPDQTVHLHGSLSQNYRDAIIRCDEWLGRIINHMKTNKYYDKTLLYVTTDHGVSTKPRADRRHNKHPNSWLSTNDTSVCRDGILADIAATILDKLGINTESLEPKLIGEPLEDDLST
jgi:hypothetical protein